MTNVIKIKFSEDLPTANQNKLRHRMELARWKNDWREAEGMCDYWRMGELQIQFWSIGLP